jgi:Fur family ferric uptake transcriptional regulator
MAFTVISVHGMLAPMKPPPAVPRLPKNHQVVLEVVRSAGHGVHLTTADVFARAQTRRPAIGFSTVYRGIQRLRDLALIDEILVPGADAAVYELAGTTHAHFRCNRCGTVADVPYKVPARAVAEIAKTSGARIDEAKVTLHGLCRTCQDPM